MCSLYLLPYEKVEITRKQDRKLCGVANEAAVNKYTSSLFLGGAEPEAVLHAWKSCPHLPAENRFCASMSNSERGIST